MYALVPELNEDHPYHAYSDYDWQGRHYGLIRMNPDGSEVTPLGPVDGLFGSIHCYDGKLIGSFTMFVYDLATGDYYHIGQDDHINLREKYMNP